MKKIAIIACVLAMFILVVANAAEIRQFIANTAMYKITIDGVEEEFEKPIVNINGSTYAPVRELCEKLGIYLSWDELEKTVMINTSDAMDCNNWIVFDEKGTYSQDDSKYGYMDVTGKIQIPAQFDYASNFSEGLAVVGMRCHYEELPPADTNAPWGEYGYINAKGKYVLDGMGSLSDFGNGMAVSGGCIINHQLEILKTDYPKVSPFSGGYAAVGIVVSTPPTWVDEKWSYIDITGERATEKEFEAVRSFSEGMAAVKKNGKWGVIDSNFNLIIDYQYDNVGHFAYGLLMVEKDGKRGYIDKTGKIVIDIKYDDAAYFFTNGLAAVKKDGKYGYINTKDEVVIPFQFVYAQRFSEGLAAVQAENGKYGYINTKGEYHVEPVYEVALQFKNGLARVLSDTENSLYHYINQKGERIDPHN